MLKDVKMNNIYRIVGSVVCVMLGAGSGHAMQALDDQALRAETGQAAFYTSYIDQGGTNPNAGVGFFTLGLQGTVALNLNANRIQLGCGGVKGPGCDIDLSQASLSGISPGPSGTYADSDAVLTNPFIQLAIKNPGTLATRQVVGLNLGAQGALGQLSIGVNSNTAAQQSGGTASPNNNTGINTLSGAIGLSLGQVTLTNVHTDLGLSGTATTSPYSQQLILNRQSLITDLGPISANASVSGILTLGLPFPISLSNVHVNNQPLAAVHNLLIQDPSSTSTNHIAAKDIALSLQSQSIQWPTSAGFNPIAAQQGWWMSLPSVSVSALTTNQYVYIPIGTALVGAFGGRVDLSALDLNQYPVKNCYGTLKFC
jgi:hypothetical protein